MKRTCPLVGSFLVGIVILSCTRAAVAAEGCNQTELSPGSEGMVSVLLLDTADALRPQLMVRDAHASGPVDAGGACPITEPYGACAPSAHGDIATIGTRLCVRYGSE